jgi:5-azacytidine-induced protein 1
MSQSSIRKSIKVSNLMDFLDSQDTESKLSFLDSISPDPDTLSVYTETKAKMINLKLEVEEANKTIETLQGLITKLKYQNEELERSWQDKLERKLQQQQKTYDEALEKNVNFIESLLKEKEQRLKYINELNSQVLQSEQNLKNKVNLLQESHKKEMKKAKDHWATSEKVRREKWEKEKTKEIKEMTARGLEPEINRIISDHRKILEEKEENQRKELKLVKESLENKHSEEIVLIYIEKVKRFT